MMQTWHNANLAIIASIHISLDDASIANMAIISIHISLDDASIASVFIASIHSNDPQVRGLAGSPSEEVRRKARRNKTRRLRLKTCLGCVLLCSSLVIRIRIKR